jgi:coiled-coil domain-containing protein 12
MSSHEALSAAANDRKTRLAQLKSLKRKQAPTTDEADNESSIQADNSTALTTTDDSDNNTVTKTYLSGRNFDPETRNVKLGFENQPISDPTSTLEYKAQQLALETKAQQDAEKAEDKGLDLFKLQPKKPNWDLKRDLEQKMKPLDVQTENAIARMVRERIEGQKVIKEKEVVSKGGNEGDGEEVGMEGSELVEAMHLKEQEEERERRREEEDEDVS